VVFRESAESPSSRPRRGSPKLTGESSDAATVCLLAGYDYEASVTQRWLSAGPSAPPITSSPSTPTPPPNAATASPLDIPQPAEAPPDFWSRWFGDATQTEWAFSAPDRRLIQPITHYDTGNRALNYALNKIVFPWENLARSTANIAIIPFSGLNDLLEQLRNDPDYGLTVQAAEVMLPLQRTLGLEMEMGPALDWLSTNLTTGSYSPLW
jgi:hypothetical protein